MRSHDTTLSSADEQILVDHERRWDKLEDRITNVFYRNFDDFNDSQWMHVAACALANVMNMETTREVVEAVNAIESAARRAKEAELPEHLRNLT